MRTENEIRERLFELREKIENANVLCAPGSTAVMTGEALSLEWVLEDSEEAGERRGQRG
jgi:hypothetical protein